MASRKKYDAAISTGLKKDGSGKKYWKTVGTVFEDEQGRLSLKLDVMPMAKVDENGYPSLWLSFFEPRVDNVQQQVQQPQQHTQSNTDQAPF